MQPRHFQFRLATLLAAMVWVGFVSLGLRTPTTLWSGVIAVLTLLTILFAVLVVIYRTGRTRAMAVGFLVLCVGYLAYLAILDGTLSAGLRSNSTPTGGAFHALFLIIHPDREATITDEIGAALRRVPVPRDYDLGDFISICNHALATFLGVLGAAIAQILHATRTPESPE